MIQLSIFFRNYVLLFSLLFSGVAFSQTEEIDDLLKKAEKSYLKYQDLQQFKYARDANLLAKEMGDSKRISQSYLNMAQALSNIGLTKECLLFLNRAASSNYAKKDLLFQCRIMEIKSEIYSQQGLFKQGLKELLKASKSLEKQKDTASREKLGKIYGHIGNQYYHLENINDALKYYKESKQLLSTFNVNEKIKYLAIYYRCYSSIYMRKGNYDSAYYFSKKSFDINSKINQLTFLDYANLGDVHAFQKKYKPSIDNYKKSISAIKKDSMNPAIATILYKNISTNYEMLNDQEKAEKYRTIFEERNSEDNELKKKNIEYVVSSILKDKEDEMNASQRKSYIWISFGILFILASLLFIYRILRKKIKQKEEKISEVTTTLEQKEKVIFEKNIEAKELKLKVNDTYNELIELAKNNDPTFYFRFQEIYPEFHNTLLKHFPGLRNTELILCAYTFLGFSIKDIAEYTFKSVNTIRNRKQNLRKKFEVPTDQDMGIWLKNLIYPNDNQ